MAQLCLRQLWLFKIMSWAETVGSGLAWPGFGLSPGFLVNILANLINIYIERGGKSLLLQTDRQQGVLVTIVAADREREGRELSS